jgi:hypothetical protein
MTDHERAQGHAYPLSDGRLNLKGLTSQDLDVSLHCHCNFAKAVSGDVFSPEGEFSEDRLPLYKRMAVFSGNPRATEVGSR